MASSTISDVRSESRSPRVIECGVRTRQSSRLGPAERHSIVSQSAAEVRVAVSRIGRGMVYYSLGICRTDEQNMDKNRDGQAHFRDGRSGQLPGQGTDLRFDRHAARAARAARPAPEIRPLYQRRPGDDESLPAWRGLCARRRVGNRPRPRPLRTVHPRTADPRLQLHDGKDLSLGHPEGTRGAILRGQDGPGDPARDRRDQGGRSTAWPATTSTS